MTDDKSKKDKTDDRNKKDKIPTIIFRAIVGCIGIAILFLILKNDSEDIFQTGIALCGLFIGYGVGGDKWGKILYDPVCTIIGAIGRLALYGLTRAFRK